MASLEKSQHAPLNVTREARHRVFVGLGWDPHEKASLMDQARALVGGKKTWHDLDLSCYMYDKNKVLIDTVTAKDGQHIDQSGNIYHSGDNIGGVGDGDDEQISVELKDLDPKICHIVFTVIIKSGHVFQDISAPASRLADGYSEYEFLNMSLHASEGREKSGFVFVHLYRSHDEPNAWFVHHVGEFLDAVPMQEWPALMAVYMKTA